MLHSPSVVSLFVLVALWTTLLPAQVLPSLSGPAVTDATVGVLQGRVLSPRGQPLAGIHVELDEARTAIPITSTYSQPDGTFAMYNIPTGEYEVVAEASDSEVSNVIRVESQKPTLVLRFPRDTTSHKQSPSTVSVAQVVAPAKAQKLYTQAHEAFRRGQYKDASNLLEQALQIEPHYPDALTLRGLLELGNPDPQVPQQNFEQALRLNPNDSTASIALAAVYNREARFDDAVRAAQRGASVSPNSWQAYLEMAKASIAQNMYAKGLVLIRQAERLGGTKYAEVRLVKAYGLFALKLFRDCKYEAQAAIARDHDGPSAHLARQLLAQLTTDDAGLAAEH